MPETFMMALELMWRGMLGIFSIVSLLYLMIKLLHKLFPAKAQ
ncbi:MAG: OadG-related small transporter subunit [Erysipelotrichaceae bacterium]|jgi:hypothetical protein|nr:OadG-related small transporter subunit [Erysipelotrichaceae bacterium]